MKRLTVLFSLACALTVACLEPTSAAMVDIGVTDGGKPIQGDPEAGKKVFMRCAACHSLDAGVNKIGPSLHGIIGRQAGTVEKYVYSAANKASGITWSEQVMFDYLKSPQTMVKGTKMAFVGIPKPQERADVIAFIRGASK